MFKSIINKYFYKKSKKKILEIPINEKIIHNETKINWWNKKKLLSLRNFFDHIDLSKKTYWDCIFLKIDDLSLINWALLEEIRRNLQDLKSNFHVISFFKKASYKEYYIASVANQIFTRPYSEINLFDFSLDSFFYKKTLNKLGIEAQFMKIGSYKTFADRWIRNHISSSQKEMLYKNLQDLKNHFEYTIKKSRNFSSFEEIYKIGTFSSQKALKYKLIDKISYEQNILKKIFNKKAQFSTSFIKDIKLPILKRSYLFISRIFTSEKIAILYMDGIIAENNYSFFLNKSPKITEEIFLPILQKIEKDKNIKGLVIRINSPGGAASTSTILYYYIRKIAKKKPVVVSMGQYAASGGYYIALPANYIFSENTSITGSIGVIFGKFSIEKLAKKIGINREDISFTKYRNPHHIWNKYTKEDIKKYMLLLQDFYKKFVKKVAISRKMSAIDIHKIAKGRVWSGYHAKKIGLIDEIGGLRESIQKVKKLCNISEDSLIKYSIYPKNDSKIFSIQNLIKRNMSIKKDIEIEKIIQDLLLKNLNSKSSINYF